MQKRVLTLAVAVPVFVLMAALVYNLPPVNARLAWRVDNLRTQIKYALNPPQQSVFVPQGNSLATPVVRVFTPTATATPLDTPTPSGPTRTPEPTFTPTISPTPLPEAMKLEGVKYEDQHARFNYCGPANLSMALTFWGWNGNRDVVGRAIKPETDDKNVMPYEMAEFAETEAELASIVRSGGDLELVKTLIANGFPVILEKGTFLTDLAGDYSWMGHYQLATGYDDARQILYVQDTYIGADYEMTYDAIIEGWRAFNYLYLVIYPPEREAEVKAILGPHWDEVSGNQVAAELAANEAFSLSGRDQFFAWFNRGTSLMSLQDYAGAAEAYDQAFAMYPSIPEVERPWRMMWYQTGPYFAYFYTGRYYDVIDLATRTLENMSTPALEESFYWRAMANAALGDTSGAIADYRSSLKLHPGFEPSLYQLEQLGVSP
ncbi:MAG TPA: C39 family peptidase [Anaerolineales bacterium]